MNDITYNGWVNRETWLVNLWLTNDQDTYETVRGMNGVQLDNYVRDIADDVAANPTVNGFMSDLVNAALSHVSWDEIAESLGAE